MYASVKQDALASVGVRTDEGGEVCIGILSQGLGKMNGAVSGD